MPSPSGWSLTMKVTLSTGRRGSRAAAASSTGVAVSARVPTTGRTISTDRLFEGTSQFTGGE